MLRAPCNIWSVARDGHTVLETKGRTRDISRTGVGFVCNRHLAKESEVCLLVHAPDGKLFHLTGIVMHTRSLRGHWYFAGVEFCKIKNQTLTELSRETGMAYPNGGRTLPHSPDGGSSNP